MTWGTTSLASHASRVSSIASSSVVATLVHQGAPAPRAQYVWIRRFSPKRGLPLSSIHNVHYLSSCWERRLMTERELALSRPISEFKAELFKALGHPARVRVLELLSEG